MFGTWAFLNNVLGTMWGGAQAAAEAPLVYARLLMLQFTSFLQNVLACYSFEKIWLRRIKYNALFPICLYLILCICTIFLDLRYIRVLFLNVSVIDWAGPLGLGRRPIGQGCRGFYGRLICISVGAP